MIIFTGIVDLIEVVEAIETAKVARYQELAILHYVSSYLVSADVGNIKTVIIIQRQFNIAAKNSEYTLNKTTSIITNTLSTYIIKSILL